MSQKGEQIDISDLGLWFSKMSQDFCPPTTERTSESFSKRPQESWNRPPLFLDMRGGGLIAESFWDESGLSLGGYTTCSFGERPSSTAIQEMYSKWGLRSVVVDSRLSQILEGSPHPKYCLSEKACQGILNRAKKRGKELPKLLEETLIRQSHSKNEQAAKGGVREYLSNTSEPEHCQQAIIKPSYSPDEPTAYRGDSITSVINQSKPEAGLCHTLSTDSRNFVVKPKCYGISPYESNSMKSSNPHSGIYEAESARTLDLNGGNPNCNQGGMMILEDTPTYSQDAYDKFTENDNSASLKACGGTYGGERGTCYIRK